MVQLINTSKLFCYYYFLKILKITIFFLQILSEKIEGNTFHSIVGDENYPDPKTRKGQF